MKRHWKRYITVIIIIVFSLMALGGCSSGEDINTPDTEQEVGQKTQSGSEENKVKELMVYSGAALRKPVEEIASSFLEETGILIQFTYGGTAHCINQILTVNKGDAFLPGDVMELDKLIENDKIERQIPVVLHVPVLAVPAGNPAGITGIEDLARPGVKVALSDPEANPAGKLADKVLKDLGLFEKVEPNIVAYGATCNEVFSYLALKQADVAIIWEDNLLDNEDIELVETSCLDNYIKIVPVASLKCSSDPEAANQFVEFVAGEKAMAIWEKHGFKPVEER